MLYYYVEQGYTSVANAKLLTDALYDLAPRVKTIGRVFWYPFGPDGPARYCHLIRRINDVFDLDGDHVRHCVIDRCTS